MTKSDFIRQYPNLTTDEVLAKAKEAGIEMKKHSVHQLRSADKARLRDGKTVSKRGKGKEPPPRGASKALILSLPMDMPVADVQKRAKKAGINPPHEGYIALIRRRAKPKRGRPQKEPGSALATIPGSALAIRRMALPPMDDILGNDMDEIAKKAMRIGLRVMRANIDQLMQNVDQM